MRVKLLVDRAGAIGILAAGSVIEVTDAEGARMVAAGQCVEIGGRDMRLVTDSGAETAATRRGGERRRRKAASA